MTRPFFETLRELRGGITLDELGGELAQAVAAVRATGKPAEIVLKLKLKPPKKGTINYIAIEDQIVTKLPKLDRDDTVFFPTKDNNLSRQEQTQQDLPLRPVRVGNSDVDSQTGEILSQERA